MAKIDEDMRRYLMWVESRGDPKFGSTFNRRTIADAKDRFWVEPGDGGWIITEDGRAALAQP